MSLPTPNSILLFVCLLLAASLAAQVNNGASTTQSRAMQAYHAITGYASRLYNGSEYIRTYSNVSGHPFLDSDSLSIGSISYEGVLYRDVFLNYDLVRDEVIIKGPQVFLLKLVPQKIDSFTIGGHRFVRYNDGNQYRLAKGFYEVLHNGRALVLASRSKRISVPSRTDEQAQFVASVNYFIINGQKVFPVSDRSDLIKAFADQQEAVKKYVQQNGFNIRNDAAQTLTRVAAFYDQISN